MSEREAAIQIGEALATLRRERGLSQADAGARIGMTSQGWSLYEAGRRAGIFRPDVQKRLTQALEATPEDLSLLNSRAAVAQPTHDDVRGVSSKGRDFDGMPPAPQTVRFRMGSNDMAPWAFADTIIEYDPNRVPRSGAGCVVELMDGRKLVGLFAQQTATQVAVHDAAGQGVTLSLANVRRVAAVIARHDA